MPLEQALSLLQQSGAEWDPTGRRFIGSGLSWIPTPHRFQVHGNRLFTWCAVDALIFPVLIGATAHIRSPCTATGDPIRIEVTPTEVRHVEPAGAVVSIFLPAVDLAEMRQTSCSRQTFYRSVEVAPEWASEHPDAGLLSVAETFEAFRRAAMIVWGAELQG